MTINIGVGPLKWLIYFWFPFKIPTKVLKGDPTAQNIIGGDATDREPERGGASHLRQTRSDITGPETGNPPDLLQCFSVDGLVAQDFVYRFGHRWESRLDSPPFGCSAPILEPILVVGLGCSLAEIRILTHGHIT